MYHDEYEHMSSSATRDATHALNARVSRVSVPASANVQRWLP